MEKEIYINPVPMIDTGKKFELRLELKFPDLITLEEARRRAAAYVKSQPDEVLASWFHCMRIEPVYPKELTNEELERLGITRDGKPVGNTREPNAGPDRP